MVKYLEHRQFKEEHKHINDWKWNGRCVQRAILTAVKAVIGFCLSIYLSPILLSTVIFTRTVMFTELWKEKVAMNWNIDSMSLSSTEEQNLRKKISKNRQIFTKSAIGGSCCSSISLCALWTSLSLELYGNIEAQCKSWSCTTTIHKRTQAPMSLYSQSVPEYTVRSTVWSNHFLHDAQL